MFSLQLKQDIKTGLRLECLFHKIDLQGITIAIAGSKIPFNLRGLEGNPK